MEDWLLNWTAFVTRNTHAVMDGISHDDGPEWYDKMWESWKRNSDHGQKLNEIRYRDIDPDSGDISSDKIICTCLGVSITNWVYGAISTKSIELDDPNREIYIKEN
jgi:hypothetical protein